MAAAMAGGQPRRAANLLGAAEVLRERSGAPAAAVELKRYEELVARLHKQLREDHVRRGLAQRTGSNHGQGDRSRLCVTMSSAPLTPTRLVC